MDGWKEHRSVNRAWRRVREMGLERNLLDLEVYGLTVITPEQIRPYIKDHLGRMRGALLRSCNEWAGGAHEFTLDTNSVPSKAVRNIFMEEEEDAREREEQQKSSRVKDIAKPLQTQFVVTDLIRQDRVIEEMVECPPTLALIEYYMHECHLSSITGFVKWQGDSYGPTLGLHTDSYLAANMGQPLPSVQYPHAMNTNWILTDYTKADGAFCIIPGSHRWQRQPLNRELPTVAQQCVPVEAPAGSVLLFHGACWHGAFPKQTPGLRLSVNAYYCQNYLKTQERFVGKVPQAMLERNSGKFASLLGFDEIWGHEDRRGPIRYKSRGHQQPLPHLRPRL